MSRQFWHNGRPQQEVSPRKHLSLKLRLFAKFQNLRMHLLNLLFYVASFLLCFGFKIMGLKKNLNGRKEFYRPFQVQSDMYVPWRPAVRWSSPRPGSRVAAGPREVGRTACPRWRIPPHTHPDLWWPGTRSLQPPGSGSHPATQHKSVTKGPHCCNDCFLTSQGQCTTKS